MELERDLRRVGGGIELAGRLRRRHLGGEPPSQRWLKASAASRTGPGWVSSSLTAETKKHPPGKTPSSTWSRNPSM